MSAPDMVAAVLELAGDWQYEAVSIGVPGPVRGGNIVAAPNNLGSGWVGFDFSTAFGRPVRIINDAAMQALGSYTGGSMLFLGLGTGLGSAMIVENVVVPMELADLPYKRGKSFEDWVGARGLSRLGSRKWEQTVRDVVDRLKSALQADHIVLGGGNARRLSDLPGYASICSNDNAFVGGFRLWEKRE